MTTRGVTMRRGLRALLLTVLLVTGIGYLLTQGLVVSLPTVLTLMGGR